MNAETPDPLDRLAGFFATDAMLLTQFNDMRRSGGDKPIKKLWIAVLEDGIRCFLGEGKTLHYFADPRTRRARLSIEARDWIFDKEATGPFSFNVLCDALGIDQSYLRERLARMDEERLQIPRRSPVVNRNGVSL